LLWSLTTTDGSSLWPKALRNVVLPEGWEWG
jgi:hypothetical protein